MKRGSSLRRHVRLARVSAKVRRERPEFDAVYRRVDQRSGGRCEVEFDIMRSTRRDRLFRRIYSRCTNRAVDHHHCVRPRRLNHVAAKIAHVCRRHHDDVSASFQNGRLYIEPNGDETFTCYYRFKPEHPFK